MQRKAVTDPQAVSAHGEHDMWGLYAMCVPAHLCSEVTLHQRQLFSMNIELHRILTPSLFLSRWHEGAVWQQGQCPIVVNEPRPQTAFA